MNILAGWGFNPGNVQQTGFSVSTVSELLGWASEAEQLHHIPGGGDGDGLEKITSASSEKSSLQPPP